MFAKLSRFSTDAERKAQLAAALGLCTLESTQGLAAKARELSQAMAATGDRLKALFHGTAAQCRAHVSDMQQVSTAGGRVTRASIALPV